MLGSQESLSFPLVSWSLLPRLTPHHKTGLHSNTAVQLHHIHIHASRIPLIRRSRVRCVLQSQCKERKQKRRKGNLCYALTCCSQNGINSLALSSQRKGRGLGKSSLALRQLEPSDLHRTLHQPCQKATEVVYSSTAAGTTFLFLSCSRGTGFLLITLEHFTWGF